MERTTILATAGAVALFTGAALAAATETSIRKVSDRDTVTLSGTVQKVKSEQEFTLRDNDGTVDVKIARDKGTILNEGDSVTVTGASGKSHRGMIEAYSVQVHQRADM